MNTRTDFHQENGKTIMTLYRRNPPLFVAVDISRGVKSMDNRLILEAIENLATGVWECAAQLERIADALEGVTPGVHNLADDGLDAARNHEPCSLAEIDAEMKRAAQEWDADTFALGVDPTDPDCQSMADDEAQRDHERYLEQLEMDAGTVSDE
jgi:hypothetical protein